jgi:hypothetical protein
MVCEVLLVKDVYNILLGGNLMRNSFCFLLSIASVVLISSSSQANIFDQDTIVNVEANGSTISCMGVMISKDSVVVNKSCLQMDDGKGILTEESLSKIQVQKWFNNYIIGSTAIHELVPMTDDLKNFRELVFAAPQYLVLRLALPYESRAP